MDRVQFQSTLPFLTGAMGQEDALNRRYQEAKRGVENGAYRLAIFMIDNVAPHHTPNADERLIFGSSTTRNYDRTENPNGIAEAYLKLIADENPAAAFKLGQLYYSRINSSDDGNAWANAKKYFKLAVKHNHPNLPLIHDYIDWLSEKDVPDPKVIQILLDALRRHSASYADDEQIQPFLYDDHIIDDTERRLYDEIQSGDDDKVFLFAIFLLLRPEPRCIRNVNDIALLGESATLRNFIVKAPVVELYLQNLAHRHPAARLKLVQVYWSRIAHLKNGETDHRSRANLNHHLKQAIKEGLSNIPLMHDYIAWFEDQQIVDKEITRNLVGGLRHNVTLCAACAKDEKIRSFIEQHGGRW